jgi:hypothetical protein
MNAITVPLRRFLNESRLQRAAALGQKTLVTYRGRLYFEVHPPEQPQTFVGRGKHLSTGQPTDGVLPADEWAARP